MTVEQLVACRRAAWQRLSDLCDCLQRRGATAGRAELAEFGQLYRQVSSDLAYATAHLAHGELLAYLNRLVARAHGQLYRPARGGIGPTVRFFARYPHRWRAEAPFLWTAGALLLAGCAAAFALVAGDPRQAALFVPLELTAQLMPSADGATTVSPAAFVAVSGFVLTNNITAALLAFATGLFLGVGTVGTLLRNGLLIGGLAGLAQSQSPAALASFLALVLPHGVIELAALTTSGAAGLKLGHALLAGGRRTRPAALRQAGAEALLLLLGCLPWFGLAALIEGFLTPMALPWAAKIVFGLLSGGLLAYYLAASAREPDDVDAHPAVVPGGRTG